MPSLLPRWRGAAPIQRAILAGDTETGVVPDADGSRAGYRPGAAASDARRFAPTTPAARCTIGSPSWAPTCLREGLRRMLAGEALHRNAAAAMQASTYAHKLDKAEARLDFDASRDRTGAQGARVRSVAGRRSGDRRRTRAHLGGAGIAGADTHAAPGAVHRGQRATASTSPAATARCAITALQRAGGKRDRCARLPQRTSRTAPVAHDASSSADDRYPRTGRAGPGRSRLARRLAARSRWRLRTTAGRSARSRVADGAAQRRRALVAALRRGDWIDLLEKPLRHKEPAIHALLVLGLVQLEILGLQRLRRSGRHGRSGARVAARAQLAGPGQRRAAALAARTRNPDRRARCQDRGHAARASGWLADAIAQRLAGTGRCGDGRRQSSNRR